MPPPLHGRILRNQEQEPHGETGKRWKKGSRGESTQYAKNANRRESEIHADEEESRHPGGQELRHILGQEETGRSDTMEAVTLQTSAPTQVTEIQMDARVWGRRKRQMRPDIGHQSHNNTSNMRQPV